MTNGGTLNLTSLASGVTADIASLNNQVNAVANVMAATTVSSLTNGGTVRVTGGNGVGSALLTANSISNSGLMLIGASTAVRVNGSTGLINEIPGTIQTLQGSTLYNFVDNRGSFQVGGYTTVTNAGGVLRNSGTVTLAGQTLSIPGIVNTGLLNGTGVYDAAVVSNGRITVDDTKTLRFTQPLTNEANGVIELKGTDVGAGPRAALQVVGSTLNQGTLTGAGYVSGAVNNLGRVTAAAGGGLVFEGLFVSSATAVVGTAGGGDFFFYGGASFQAGATITAPLAMFRNRLDTAYSGSTGLLTVHGETWLAGTAYYADILGTGTGQYDRLVTDSMRISEGATLHLNSSTFVLQAGQTYDLFDWNSVIGKFASIDTSELTLAAGTQLDTSRLYIDGTISVTAVPEPSAWMLMASGLLWVWRRQRTQRESV